MPKPIKIEPVSIPTTPAPQAPQPISIPQPFRSDAVVEGVAQPYDPNQVYSPTAVPIQIRFNAINDAYSTLIHHLSALPPEAQHPLSKILMPTNQK